MARKTKENLEEINEKVEKVTRKRTTKTAEKSKPAVKSVAKKEPNSTTKKTANKKESEATTTTAKKEDKTATKKATAKKTATKKDDKTVAKQSTAKKSTTKKEDKTVARKSTAKKSTTKKEDKTVNRKSTTKKSTAKKTAIQKEDKTVAKKTTTKKATAKKDGKTAAKKTTTKKVATKKDTKTTTRKSTKKAQAEIVKLDPIEYYDLPYRYNQTVVKVLAQNPNTLFAYWDIADSDRENFEKTYGKLFFYNTRPVLVVHNLTDNYTFEIDIDDFANNWYIHVSDAKCQYVVELGRRPKYEQHQDIPVNYLNVAFSNTVEIPNDHIIFFKDNDRIYFKNIKTNKITEKVFNNKTDSHKVKHIYKDYNLSDDRFDFKNPFSQNPTSTVL